MAPPEGGDGEAAVPAPLLSDVLASGKEAEYVKKNDAFAKQKATQVAKAREASEAIGKVANKCV